MLGLWGFKGQGMRGEKAAPTGYFTALSPGDTSWTCPRAGRYTFTIRGGGDCGVVGTNPGGYSGAAASRTVLLSAHQVIALSIGRGGSRDTSQGGSPPGRATATSVTFPDRSMVAEAGNGALGIPATASGGDQNITGSTAASDGAPAIGTFPNIAPSTSTYLVPGPGASNTPYGPGGAGIVFISRAD